MMLSIVLLIMRLDLIDKLGLSAGGNRIRTAKAGVGMVKGVDVCVVGGGGRETLTFTLLQSPKGKWWI